VTKNVNHQGLLFYFLQKLIQINLCTRLAAASDKVYQLLAHGRWFSPGTPASSTTKTGCHDIAEILLKGYIKHNKSINQSMGKQLVNFITCSCESSAPFFVIYKAGNEPTPYW
jgi:hypothetical protein